ncbi:hypothetical protein SEA_CHASER_142 [Mycobacterium phage Chaser]|nr:hypothetical protein SEA_CHASER_142 [Mycobacterium phage Chaser]
MTCDDTGWWAKSSLTSAFWAVTQRFTVVSPRTWVVHAEGKRIPRIGRDESHITKSVDVSKLVAAHKAAVVAYERKHGRYAAHVYARGGYWSLLRVIRTAMAVGAIATQGPSAPALAAANAALMAAYWAHRAGR